MKISDNLTNKVVDLKTTNSTSNQPIHDCS